MIDLSDICYIKKIRIGTCDPSNPQSEEESEKAMELLNKCLSENPKGKVIAIDKSFSVLQLGEHNVVLQWVNYHIGFSRRPYWLEDNNG